MFPFFLLKLLKEEVVEVAEEEVEVVEEVVAVVLWGWEVFLLEACLASPARLEGPVPEVSWYLCYG